MALSAISRNIKSGEKHRGEGAVKGSVKRPAERLDVWSLTDKKVVSLDPEVAVESLYYLSVRPATDAELKKAKSSYTEEAFKQRLSTQDRSIPLYDVYTFNIYVIQRRNIYHRVINNHYRFPDRSVLRNIEADKEKMIKKAEKDKSKKSDMVFMKRIRKAELMLQFMSYFDLDELFNTYLRVFYQYAPELGNMTYTCLRRSFIPHKDHLLPYYTKDEVIRLGMNNGLVKIPKNEEYHDHKDKMSDADYADLCAKIQDNDISSNTLLMHQNYIIENNSVGLVQYYTVQGSFFINQYMRQMTKYPYQNDYLEHIIESMWKLTLKSPAFDKNYILYRFVADDAYLQDMKIGDEYRDPGFTSTTRDPFYKTDSYQFGFILIKIKIPKGVKGVGLCIETLSHFPTEEEIILPPLSILKLVSKDSACEYYHPDSSFSAEVKKRYEFEWVGHENVQFAERLEWTDETKEVDFLQIEKPHALSIKERINALVSTQFDPMNRIKCRIGNNAFYVVGEYYNSTGAYEPMYALTTSEGFSLYSIYNGYMLFMIEIGEESGDRQIRVNYYSKYSELKRDDIMGDNNFIEFISSIAYYFDIANVIIYADYYSCDHDVEQSGGAEVGGGAKVETKTDDHVMRLTDLYRRQNIKKRQREFASKDGELADGLVGNTEGTDDADIVKLKNDEDMPEYTGGSYCVDFYRYLKYGTKRYADTDALHIELKPKFEYRDLDIMKEIKPSLILSKTDRDEMYQIYIRAYLPSTGAGGGKGIEEESSKHNLADLYIWMIENKCYLMDIFVAKLDRLYKERNPFKKGYYVLDSMAYLYNRSKISTYSRFIKMNIDEEHQLLTLPKNEYRIIRKTD